MSKIQILLVEKNLILSDYLTTVFNQDELLNVVGIFGEGAHVMEFLAKNSVDIVLMDYLQINGLEITDKIHKQFPRTKVIGFSSCEKTTFDQRLIELGATCYLSKYDTDLDKLIHEIKTLC